MTDTTNNQTAGSKAPSHIVFCFGKAASFPNPSRQKHGLWTRSHAALASCFAPFPARRKGNG